MPKINWFKSANITFHTDIFSNQFSILTAACCTRSGFYTHTHTLKKVSKVLYCIKIFIVSAKTFAYFCTLLRTFAHFCALSHAFAHFSCTFVYSFILLHKKVSKVSTAQQNLCTAKNKTGFMTAADNLKLF